MTHTWKYALALGFVGATLAAGCVVKNGDDDTGAGGQGAEGGTGGSTGGTGGSTGGKGGSAGTGGSTGGKGGSAGAPTGGSSSAGKGGTGGSGTGGDAGMAGGDTGGTGGSTGGTGGVDTTPSCDDDAHPGTPYPDCEPAADEMKDPCALCIKANCCMESKDCYATDPYNVCGWGGPADYLGAGEIACYTECLATYVNDNDVCDTAGIDQCAADCTTTTPMCDLIGNATSAMAGCMQENCPSECFGADTCG
jgi:hypothetical protein